ncbi:hypothetical protein LINPERHAP1_LOCUS12150 [Linum perenne]
MEESLTDSAVRTTLPSPSHSSESFSLLPSEPPDIRNWFSSYKYESFVLDTCDDAFRLKARGDDAEKIRANDDGDSSEPLRIEEGQSFNEVLSLLKWFSPFETLARKFNLFVIKFLSLAWVPDSSYSQPALNELHHPDNWLSTCVPETCGLDPGGDDKFETAPSQGKDDAFIKNAINRSKKSSDLGAPEGSSSDEFFMNEFQLREGSEDSPLHKVPDSSYSVPVFHEHHHPENWLSTCVSDTCGLDPDDDKFEIPASQGKHDTSVKEANENSNIIRCDFDTLEKPSSDELVANVLQFREASEESPLRKAPYSQSFSILSEPPDINNWFSSLAYESPLLDEEISNEVVESESQHVDNSSIKQEPKEDRDMNSSQSIDKEPSTKLTPDEHSASSVSGFVTTRKNKTTKRPNNDENSCPRSRNVQAKCLKNSAERLVSSSRNRKVLSERTNEIEQQQQPEFTGKWKCPQRSKPVIGPPLKQLRLERWITKL